MLPVSVYAGRPAPRQRQEYAKGLGLLQALFGLMLCLGLPALAWAQDNSERSQTPQLTSAQTPAITTIESVTELMRVFDQHDYYWPPADGRAPVVPRLNVDDLPAGWNDHLTIVEKKSVFIRLLLPLILLANEQILAQRTRLLDAIAIGELPQVQGSEWYALLLEQYGLEQSTEAGEVLRRVDMIPPALAAAQAALESGWGSSRFFTEGNALYAEWIWGSGMEPHQQREELGDYGVQSFSSLLRSAQSYANNLNSNEDYAEFRRRRAELRTTDAPLSGCSLADSLDNYSELSAEEYSRRLCSIMEDSSLALADSAVLAPAPLELLRFGD